MGHHRGPTSTVTGLGRKLVVVHASFPVKSLLEVFRVTQGFVVKSEVVQGTVIALGDHSRSDWVTDVTHGGDLAIVQANAFLAVQLPYLVYACRVRWTRRSGDTRLSGRYTLWAVFLEEDTETATSGKL